MKIPVGVFFINKIVTDSNRKRKKALLLQFVCHVIHEIYFPLSYTNHLFISI